MNLNGTKTQLNLKKALAGESIARNQYTFFAEQAKEQGLSEIAEFFERLAINEKNMLEYGSTYSMELKIL